MQNTISIEIVPDCNGEYYFLNITSGTSEHVWVSKRLTKDDCTELLVRISSQHSLLCKLSHEARVMFLSDEQKYSMKIRV